MGSGRPAMVERGKGWWSNEHGEVDNENISMVGSRVMGPGRLMTVASCGAVKEERGGGLAASWKEAR